uniref:nicotinamide/nicotinic acid mononucleotide adenylyltransferase 3-like n=1 Tax=Ciona intestinalis TaxID=7719 RepID=UPI000180C1C8|nr:nicotinamide/nicotinic acid mononucleotide adenylyltransferase 3-like [Ciona intestinalis]|eukprot:XP_009862493.1 nicotinamide/nicotinic acid mononucleotide adenylyltransferase 3-like [Ciona intestinalis]
MNLNSVKICGLFNFCSNKVIFRKLPGAVTFAKNSMTQQNSKTMSQQEVGFILCGAINPITNMHLKMFDLARDYFHKNTNFKVKFGGISPTADSYGKPELVNAKHRQNMIKLALQENSWVSLLDWESNLNKWTPTEKVLTHYKQNEPKCKELKLFLLCGADLMQSFVTPGLWKESDIRKIVNNFGLVVITRASYDPREFIKSSPLMQELSPKIHIVEECIENKLSSTKIRKAVLEGRSIKYLTPDVVIEYINEHGLYQKIEQSSFNVLAPFRNNKE